MDWSQFRTWLTEKWALVSDQTLAWLIAGAVFLVVFFALRLVLAVIKRRLQCWAELSKNDWDNALCRMLDATHSWFPLLVSAYFALQIPDLPEHLRPIIGSAAVIALLLQAALWGNALLHYKLSRYVERQVDTDPASATTVSMLSFVGKLVLWTVVLLLALDNIGIDVTALIAGLGIGGIAIALASQNILGDLFSALSIVLDKPFVLGDFIIVGDMMGSVEKIGLKTTRLRSLSGEQLIFSNADLLQSRIRNFKRMFERRVLFTIGVTYQTPLAKLEAIPGMIRQVVAAQPDIRFDRSHLKEFGDSAITFETVYFVLSAEYNRYMDIQQTINLALFRLFEKEAIAFAYPTQTVFLENANAVQRAG